MILKYNNGVYTYINCDGFSELLVQAEIVHVLSRVQLAYNKYYVYHINDYLHNELGLYQTLIPQPTKETNIVNINIPYDLDVGETEEYIKELYPEYVYPYDTHPCGNCAYYGDCKKDYNECEYTDMEEKLK